ncbi:MAG: aspartate/glutamate racemase family protein [Dehalococcoidales bacterium]|nr:aspartate/glutamate racemase family protein [Dehalococcoidales bacterium]
MATIHRIIYNELCQGRFKSSSRRTCIDIINRLVGRGAEGIILGYTELPLLIQPGDMDVPVFDTTRLHAEAAVNMALAEGNVAPAPRHLTKGRFVQSSHIDVVNSRLLVSEQVTLNT